MEMKWCGRAPGIVAVASEDGQRTIRISCGELAMGQRGLILKTITPGGDEHWFFSGLPTHFSPFADNVVIFVFRTKNRCIDLVLKSCRGNTKVKRMSRAMSHEIKEKTEPPRETNQAPEW
jgi:hypothetical protein